MNLIRLLRALEFASLRHSRQRRKDADASPYINHPIAVASVLASAGRVTDDTLLSAALLHDTIEDTETTAEEIEAEFGPDVAALVVELTDDKSLPKAARKQLQIDHAAGSSSSARQLKIADKICNIRDMVGQPPSGWPIERRREYLAWAESVIAGCRGVNADLEAAFDETLARAREALAQDS